MKKNLLISAICLLFHLMVNATNNPLLTLTISGYGSSCECKIGFRPDGSIGFNGNIDAYKLWGAGSELCANTISTDSTEVAIYNLPDSMINNVSVPIEISVDSTTTYKITASNLSSFGPSIEITLIDLVNNTVTKLNQTSSYSFSSCTIHQNKRFLVHFGTIISNTGPYCTGNVINLSFLVDGMKSYSWSGPNGFSNTTQNPTINNATIAMSGNYIISAVTNNNQTITSTMNVTVNSLPATPVIIQKDNTLISNAPAGNQWYMTSGLIKSETNSTYIPKTTDDYYVIDTVNGCSSNKSNVIQVKFGLDKMDTVYAPGIKNQLTNNPIILSIKDSCLFDYSLPVDTFYVASVQIINFKMYYNWVFKQGVKIYNIVSEIDINKVSSGYNLIYLTVQCNESKIKGVQSNTFVTSYNNNTVSVENIKQSSLSVIMYPNPVNDKMTIELNNQKEGYNLEILNLAGMVVLNKKITNSVQIPVKVTTQFRSKLSS